MNTLQRNKSERIIHNIKKNATRWRFIFLLKKVLKKICLIIQYSILKYFHKFIDSRTKSNLAFINQSFISINKLNTDSLDTHIIEYFTTMYLNHRFDLLGSGWVKNSYQSECLGVEGFKYEMNLNRFFFDVDGDWLRKILNKNHIEYSKKVWNMISSKYEPIDWQKDFKSGYRWDNKKWYKDCLKIIGKIPGVDIKVPWELSRFQHILQMAVFSIPLNAKREQVLLEFKNQVLDYIATNPLNIGVTWSCTMDVSIRAVNLLMAYDILVQIDNKRILDDSFKIVFTNLIYDHGKFIVNNLEYDDNLTSNHYLSNIAGLLFISAYMPAKEETNLWLAFSIQELVCEFEKQFYSNPKNTDSRFATL